MDGPFYFRSSTRRYRGGGGGPHTFFRTGPPHLLIRPWPHLSYFGVLHTLAFTILSTCAGRFYGRPCPSTQGVGPHGEGAIFSPLLIHTRITCIITSISPPTLCSSFSAKYSGKARGGGSKTGTWHVPWYQPTKDRPAKTRPTSLDLSLVNCLSYTEIWFTSARSNCCHPLGWPI